MLVVLEVLGEVVNAFGQQRDLRFGGARVGLMQTVLLEDLRLLLGCQSHAHAPWLFQFAFIG